MMWRDLLTKEVISQAAFWDGWKLLAGLGSRAQKSRPELSCWGPCREDHGSNPLSLPRLQSYFWERLSLTGKHFVERLSGVKFFGANASFGSTVPTLTLVGKSHFPLSSLATYLIHWLLFSGIMTVFYLWCVGLGRNDGVLLRMVPLDSLSLEFMAFLIFKRLLSTELFLCTLSASRVQLTPGASAQFCIPRSGLLAFLHFLSLNRWRQLSQVPKINTCLQTYIIYFGNF